MDDDDLDSSPIIAAPELHAEIFGSPARKGRVPGVSVLTPAKAGIKEGGGRNEVAVRRDQTPRQGMVGKEGGDLWDSESEGEEAEGGMSPPKTMQFHVPQARLMRTPGWFFLSPFSFFLSFVKVGVVMLTSECSKGGVEADCGGSAAYCWR